ncbi:hypothetical protein TTHERM_00047590 (macronuclear) [Tetrahymena thermophila SB210]|uniref:Uncharacterized protein n=1 Tax=Tetrahymena thermophila (strain SB210) TaxID=312017 RepID=Q23DD2_TETTS|nr:hypothetical protein TTHERM_00047590 [Tetrahymena thermophila SB210]EAR94712.2 hypothetical protein TTHERM_00047590 [Tetrahymena thermophila SB210]|eukprot:XP_001014754.2 hypothetical protein TTHERM_00047590 [Tetrahymena thermophila SB210]
MILQLIDLQIFFIQKQVLKQQIIKYKMASRGQLQDGTSTKRSRPSKTQLKSDSQMPLQTQQYTQNMVTQSSQNNLPTYSQNMLENDSSLEKMIMDMNLQMQYLTAQNEIKNQQNENIMRMQQQRIIQLQQMCEQMKSELDQFKEGKIQQLDRNLNMQQGLSHLDMLNEFEMLSKNTPFSYKQSFIDNSKQNQLQGGDSLNQFMHQFNAGFTPQNTIQRQIPPSQQSYNRQQQFQEPRLNSRQNSYIQPNNHFKSAASLALNQPQNNQFYNYDPQTQAQNIPIQQQNMSQQNFNNQNTHKKESKFNPIIDRIEQQNEMLMKMIQDMDGKQNKGKSKKKKRSDESSDESEYSDIQEEKVSTETKEEQKYLEKKIEQLENSIKQQKLQNQYMIDNNIQNPDMQYLIEAANQRKNSFNQQNPQQFANSVYNQQQFGAAQMPSAQIQKNSIYANLPTPEQFLSQVNLNQSKFQQNPSQQMNIPPNINPLSGGLGRPQFINENSQVPHPDILSKIFQQQLLNSRKNQI